MGLLKSAALAAMALATPAGAAILDFEDFAPGTNMNQYGAFAWHGLTVTITSGKANRPATIFDTLCGPSYGVACSGGDDDLSSPFQPSADSHSQDILVAGNALIVNERRNTSNPDDNARGGRLSIHFDKPVWLTMFDLLDVEEFSSADLWVDSVQMVSGMSVDADGRYMRHAFDAPVRGQSFDFDLAGSGALDNLEVSAVPGPMALPLMLTGMGAFWVARRRRA